jgi:hypothetical protein
VRFQAHPRAVHSRTTTQNIQKEVVETQGPRVHHQITQSDTQGPCVSCHTIQIDTALALNHTGALKHARGLLRIAEAHMRGTEQPTVKDGGTQAEVDDTKLPFLVSNGAAVEAQAAEETPTQTFSPEQETFLQVQTILYIPLVR